MIAQWTTNLLVAWRDPLRRRYLILREIVIALGLFEWVGLSGGFYFLGREDSAASGVFFAVLAVSYYISYKLAYTVQELLIQLATRK